MLNEASSILYFAWERGCVWGEGRISSLFGDFSLNWIFLAIVVVRCMILMVEWCPKVERMFPGLCRD